MCVYSPIASPQSLRPAHGEVFDPQTRATAICVKSRTRTTLVERRVWFSVDAFRYLGMWLGLMKQTDKNSLTTRARGIR